MPQSICRTQTIPVKVTNLNLKDCVNIVKTNNASSVLTKEGRKVVLGRKIVPRVEVGMTVNRHLKDGDWVVLNRQPSLHKESMMGHKVKVVPGNTFRLSVACTTPYNADFDGDEMNLHVCQSVVARAEVSSLMNVANQIVSPQKNGPVISLVQDGVLGVWLLTQPDVLVAKTTFFDCVMVVKYPTKPVPPTLTLTFTGRDLVSLVVPQKIYLPGLVVGGQVIGVLDKTSIKKVVHVVFLDCGPEACMRFVSDLQRITTRYLMGVGFSVGVEDCVVDLGLGLGSERASKMDFDEAGCLVKERCSKSNAMLQMTEAGSKGSMVNIVQISACVGQQFVEGKEVEDGFVGNSFLSGLTPREYFVHAQGGREGLVDTAVKTASTGYIQRRLVKLMEDQCVRYDGTVRNSRNKIVQFSYNGDGLDATWLENVDGAVVPLNIRRVARMHEGATPLAELKPLVSAMVRRVLGERAAVPQLGVVARETLDLRVNSQSFLEECERRLRRAKIDAGTMVGALAATSLGEPCTQMCLNSFHLAGVGGTAKMTSGVPRFKELLNCTSKIRTPSMVLPGTDFLAKELWMEQILVPTTLDIPKMFYDMHVVSGPRTKFEIEKTKCEHASFLEIVASVHRSCSEPPVYTAASSERWLLDVDPGDVDALMAAKIGGIEGVSEQFVDGPNTQTQGSNLIAAFRSNPAKSLDVQTNDVVETMKILGIEAASKVLAREMSKTLLASTYVNSRHIQQVADTMAGMGVLMPVSRHGMAGAKLPVLMRASFEETKDVFCKAAMFNEVDRCTGVTDAIILGTQFPGGTGSTAVVVPKKATFKYFWDPLDGFATVDVSVDECFGPGPCMCSGICNCPKAMTPLGTDEFYAPMDVDFEPWPAPAPDSPDSPGPDAYLPDSPVYCPSSPVYCPSSPVYCPSSPSYCPSSPVYCPSSPSKFVPRSPVIEHRIYVPRSPSY